jgi:hypothetical protein
LQRARHSLAGTACLRFKHILNIAAKNLSVKEVGSNTTVTLKLKRTVQPIVEQMPYPQQAQTLGDAWGSIRLSIAVRTPSSLSWGI